MFSHGAIWNFVPLSIREQTIGDLLRPHGIRVALAGKTHFAPDLESARRLGVRIEPDRRPFLEGGFEADRSRTRVTPTPGPDHPYVRFLREAGYDTDDPWESS